MLGALSVISILGSPGASGRPGARVTGTVLDQSGAPIAHALIRLFSPDQLREVESDDHGKFAFTELPSGAYELQANSLGFETAVEDFQVATDDIGPLSIELVSPGFPSIAAGVRPRRMKQENRQGLDWPAS